MTADAEIVRRLEALSEELILTYFWSMRDSDSDPFALLRQVGAVKVRRPSTWDRKAIRREHETGVSPSKWYGEKRCFCCRTADRRLYFHHVVEVQNGGSNARRNLVPLCFKCHQALHPWLKDEPAPIRTHGLEPVQSVMGRVAESIAPLDRDGVA